MLRHLLIFFFFFFNDTATTEIYTLSLHDALPISQKILERLETVSLIPQLPSGVSSTYIDNQSALYSLGRSEEHTSELQSQSNLVCRLLLEKKKKKKIILFHTITYK